MPRWLKIPLAAIPFLLFVGLPSGPAFAAPIQPASPTASPSAPAGAEPEGVAFTLLKDEVDADGRWQQTFRLLVKPGGTLADASELIYGTSDHIGELFAAIKQQYPDLRGPALIPANLEADIALDPRVAFVPRSVSADATSGTTTYEYYNGARRVVFDPKRAVDVKGLSAILDLPGDRPAKTFTVLEDFVPREVPAGVRIAYYELQPADNLDKVVVNIYGTNSVRASRDFLTQTQWDPNRWPPPPLLRSQRLVIPNGTSFADSPFTPIDVARGNAAAGDRLNNQLAARAKAGVFPVQRQPYGTVYHVVATDFNLTARQVSQLLYGHEDRYLAIAAMAGFGTLHDLEISPPQDVRLFSRAFDVLVDYELEGFPALQNDDPKTGHRTTVLLNGTIIDEWSLDPGKNGLLRQVSLPSGYRKLLYRPSTLSALAGHVFYSLLSLGQRSPTPQVELERQGGFVSRFVWDWGRSLPRSNGEAFDYGTLIRVPQPDSNKVDELLEIALRPTPENGLERLPFYRPWLGSPFVFGAAIVLAVLIVFVAFGFVARRV